MKQVLLITPISAISQRIRVKKIAQLFHDNKFEITHLGWERIKGERKENLSYNINKKIIISGGGYSGKMTRFLYPLWIIKVILYLMYNGRKYSAIYCMGFESALPAVLVNFFLRKKLIFDDADRLLLILSLPSIIYKSVQALEKLVSTKSFIHIIPNAARYDYHTNKMVIIKNTPDENEYTRALELEVSYRKTNLTVYINGWLGKVRGIPIFYEVAKGLVNENITFLLAGRRGCKEAELMKELKNVKDLGELNNDQAMSYYKVSDIVVTYYDPIMRINQYAEANKWGDAICFNIPVLVNEEVKTAQFLKDANACFSFKYSDVNGVTNLLRELNHDQTSLVTKRENLKMMQKEIVFFDKAIKNALKEILYAEN